MEKVHIKSNFGIEMRLPDRFFSIRTVYHELDYKVRWTVKRREQLIDRMKRLKAMRNMIIKWALRVIGIIISFFIGGCVAYIFSQADQWHNHSTKIGILAAEVIIIGWLLTWWLTSWIETDSYLIKVKRRGKYL